MMNAGTFAATLLLLVLTACGSGGGDSNPAVTPVDPPEVVREQDSRTFVAPSEATFGALGGNADETDRWVGTLDGAAYRVEVPKRWNGVLLLWARGYLEGANLYIENPYIRRYLVNNGYAWAASSYTKNYYDVNAGIEDTNKLARAFKDIAAAHGRVLDVPRRTVIAGWSMGGHIAAAAVDAEVVNNAVNRFRYDGALSLCGTVDDLEWYSYIAAYQMAAQYLLGSPAETYPSKIYEAAKLSMRSRLERAIAAQDLSDAGVHQLYGVLENLSGGARPFYKEGWFDWYHQNIFFLLMNEPANLLGVLSKNALDTRSVKYEMPAELMSVTDLDKLNSSILRLQADAAPNPVRRVGLRWVPVVSGELVAPVMTLHTLGDLTVPVVSQAHFKQRVLAKSAGARLAQRLVRDVGHCSFTQAEVTTALRDLMQWIDDGKKPADDDLSKPDSWRFPTAGCAHTDNRSDPEDRADPARRAKVQAAYPACSLH